MHDYSCGCLKWVNYNYVVKFETMKLDRIKVNLSLSTNIVIVILFH